VICTSFIKRISRKTLCIPLATVLNNSWLPLRTGYRGKYSRCISTASARSCICVLRWRDNQTGSPHCSILECLSRCIIWEKSYFLLRFYILVLCKNEPIKIFLLTFFLNDRCLAFNVLITIFHKTKSSWLLKLLCCIIIDKISKKYLDLAVLFKEINENNYL